MNSDWSKLRDKPHKLIRKIERTCDDRHIDLEERQSGSSHWVGTTDRGIVVVPVHGEIAKGTFGSIMRTLVRLGIALFVVLCGLGGLITYFGGLK